MPKKNNIKQLVNRRYFGLAALGMIAASLCTVARVVASGQF